MSYKFKGLLAIGCFANHMGTANAPKHVDKSTPDIGSILYNQNGQTLKWADSLHRVGS
jgi:hypothetical protein